MTMPSSSAATTARKRSSLSRSALSAASRVFSMVGPLYYSPRGEEVMDEQEDAIELPITDVLDLHSFRPAEVRDVVRDYLDAAYDKGLRDLRIIHGKGIGVQRQTVRTILERDPRVEGFGDAETWGATWVRMK